MVYDHALYTCMQFNPVLKGLYILKLLKYCFYIVFHSVSLTNLYPFRPNYFYSSNHLKRILEMVITKQYRNLLKNFEIKFVFSGKYIINATQIIYFLSLMQNFIVSVPVCEKVQTLKQKGKPMNAKITQLKNSATFVNFNKLNNFVSVLPIRWHKGMLLII